MFLLFEPYYTCRITGINYKQFIFNGFLKPLLLNIVLGLFIFYLKFVVKAPLVFTLSSLAIIGPLYCFAGYFFILNKYEKIILNEAFRKVTGKKS